MKFIPGDIVVTYDELEEQYLYGTFVSYENKPTKEMSSDLLLRCDFSSNYPDDCVVDWSLQQGYCASGYKSNELTLVTSKLRRLLLEICLNQEIF